MSAQIVVYARWRTTAESLGSVLALAAELRRRSLEEPGCLGYELLQDDEASDIVLLERYRDRGALEAHRSAAHYRELVSERILPLLTARRVELLRPRDGGAHVEPDVTGTAEKCVARPALF